MSDVAVIGLGAMGTALAEAFLNKGHSVTVWNRSPAKAQALAAKGAVVAASLEDAVRSSQLIVVCLLVYDTVHEVLAPAQLALSGRTVVNLTNGTPEQAREMSDWAVGHGADYIDGGVMAVPPMIGGPHALILYSGSSQAFDACSGQLGALGTSKYLGEDAGLAPLYDISLLTGMYGMFAGTLHALALTGAAGIPAGEFVPLLASWLQAMQGLLPKWAEQIESGDHTSDVVSNLGMQADAYVNLIDASRSANVSTELVLPMQSLMKRGVAAGQANADLSSLVALLRLSKQGA
ncbi:NAD(P)-dependent oxidoreductase [Mesorhizobium sp. WSM4303]|uniref:NAD(P)-dependent oxidoreductase n=1 Tax=unclassified Mesorhizobium TaxID=325217 RepID=UPI00115E58E2|nr:MULTISPECIES: NAD(P)-binding domain-containing protein [unclassified Mesorhizobium]TRC90401.1 NAD(P)-dependent oxidoreductase [Mesorhizobium sp. WSM4306]TRC97815.1 NAD(P)-dependent oxidoreductase [Mesorhizobium sp. WSM4303]